MDSLGASLNPDGARFSGSFQGLARCVSVGGRLLSPPEDAWDGQLPADHPVARGWVGCLGRPLPLVDIDGRPARARDAWARLLAGFHREVGASAASAATLPLAMAVPTAMALDLRPRNDLLAAAREAGFRDPWVLPAAVAIACHHDAETPLPEGRPVLVLDARADSLELILLVKHGGRWMLATAPRRIRALGGDARVRRLVVRLLEEFPPETLGEDAFRADVARLERALSGALDRSARGEHADVAVPYRISPGRGPAGEAVFRLSPTSLIDLDEAELPSLREAVGRSCADLRIGAPELAAVLGAGDWFRVSAIESALERNFGLVARVDRNAGQSAALGAARWSAQPHGIAIFGEEAPLRRGYPTAAEPPWGRNSDGPVTREDSPGWARLRLELPLPVGRSDADGWSDDLLAWSSGLPLGLRVSLTAAGRPDLTVDLPGRPSRDLVRAYERLLVGHRDWLLGAIDEPPVAEFDPIDEAGWQAVVEGVSEVANAKYVGTGIIADGGRSVRLAIPGRPPIIVVADGPAATILLPFEDDRLASNPARLRLNDLLLGVALIRDRAGGLHLRASFPPGHLNATDIEAIVSELLAAADEARSGLHCVHATRPRLLVGADR